jgi:hypothetical protein
MAKLILIALAATAAAAPLGAQPGPDYGPPPREMGPPPPGLQAPDAPPPGVSWRERAPAGARRYVVQPPTNDMAPGVRTRTWVEQGAPPPPPPPGMAGGMHHYDGPPPPMDGRHYDGRYDGRHYDGRNDEGRDGVRRHVEIRRYGRGPGFVPPQVGWEGGWQGGYGMEGPMLPPPCPRACPQPPMPYGYGYGYGAAGATIVTETTVTEAPVVQRRVYYTTVRERIRVAPRHHRVCRCKLVKARPTAGERG